MEYLLIMHLIARHPMYLFSPQCYEPPSIDQLVAERNDYIALYVTAETRWWEYVECLQRSDDGGTINSKVCTHTDLTFAQHNDILKAVEDNRPQLRQKIDAIGNKIERLMRKKLRL